MSDPDDRLIACLAEIERHVSASGWDQPARLFALVPTAELLDREPQLRDQVAQTADDALTAVEQDGFANGSELFERLAGIYWPASVVGTAIALERTFLPPRYEAEIPADPVAAVDFVNRHPERTDVRVVVGVLRDGCRHGLARLVSEPDELLGAPDLVPGLADALLQTLEGTAR